MANIDNSCAKLEIKDLWEKRSQFTTDTLGDILNLQAETQKNVYGYNFEDMTLASNGLIVNHSMINQIDIK